MTARIDTVFVDGGLEITRLVTSENKIIVPSTMEGLPVVSIGAAFLRDSFGGGNRTLVVPSSVVRASPEALYSTAGMKLISYLGDFDTFNSFKWSISTDCQVMTGDGFTFQFLNGYPMCFPEFDDAILTSHQRISEATVMARLSNPVHLTDENREKYIQYMRSRTVPMAEHSIIENDINTLKNIIDTKLLSIDDLHSLLESSVRAGRTSSTSVIMTALNDIHHAEE